MGGLSPDLRPKLERKIRRKNNRRRRPGKISSCGVVATARSFVVPFRSTSARRGGGGGGGGDALRFGLLGRAGLSAGEFLGNERECGGKKGDGRGREERGMKGAPAKTARAFSATIRVEGGFFVRGGRAKELGKAIGGLARRRRARRRMARFCSDFQSGLFFRIGG